MELDFIYYGLATSWLASRICCGRAPRRKDHPGGDIRLHGMGPDPVSMAVLGVLVLAAAAMPRVLRSWHGRRILGALLLSASLALASQLWSDPTERGWGIAISTLLLVYAMPLLMSRPHGACSRCGAAAWLPLQVDGAPACGDTCYADALLRAGHDAMHARLERGLAVRNGMVTTGLLLIGAGVVGLPSGEPSFLLFGIPLGLALLAVSIPYRWAVLLAAARSPSGAHSGETGAQQPSE